MIFSLLSKPSRGLYGVGNDRSWMSVSLEEAEPSRWTKHSPEGSIRAFAGGLTTGEESPWRRAALWWGWALGEKKRKPGASWPGRHSLSLLLATRWELHCLAAVKEISKDVRPKNLVPVCCLLPHSAKTRTHTILKGILPSNNNRTPLLDWFSEA